MYAHTGKDCKMACDAQERGIKYTPPNGEIRKFQELARKDVCVVAPRVDEKNKANTKEKVKTSGTNTKTCPVKNTKRDPGAKVDREDRLIVDPTTIDGKKAILGYGTHASMTYQQVLSKLPKYVNWVLEHEDPQGGMATFRQWLLLQPQIVRASTVANKASSAEAKTKKTPCGAAKGDKTAKPPRAPKKAAAVESDKLSVKKTAKPPNRSGNKKAKTAEPAKARKPAASAKPLRRVDINVRANNKRKRSDVVDLVNTDSDNSSLECDDDDSSNYRV